MRYIVTKHIIQVVGHIWQPGAGVCAMAYTLDARDLDNLGDPKYRGNVEDWLMCHSGDFQSIGDFRADFHVGAEHIVHEWADADSEFVFNDAMYPSED